LIRLPFDDERVLLVGYSRMTVAEARKKVKMEVRVEVRRTW
jgi:hypothetical protein